MVRRPQSLRTSSSNPIFFRYGLNPTILFCGLLVYIEFQVMGKRITQTTYTKLSLSIFWFKYLGRCNHGTKSSSQDREAGD